MFVKPQQGVLVRDPDTMLLLPEAGAEVPESRYWARRLRDGSVIEAEPTTETKNARKTKPLEEAS
jgi:hypothetical protein